jgi:hypothetical protein
MSQWDMAATRNQIKCLYGHQQLEMAVPALRSVIDRRDYAYYHYHEANDLFRAFSEKRLANEPLMWVIHQSDESFFEFHRHITKIGAHVVACIQSLHAIADIMSHAVYYSLGMNRSDNSLREANISVTTILDQLSGSAELSIVHRLLTELAWGGSADHLAALSNYSKHRSIIRTAMTEDWTGEEPERHRLTLGGFSYKGKSFPDARVKDFLTDEHDRIARLIVDTGNAVHAVLQIRRENS